MAENILNKNSLLNAAGKDVMGTSTAITRVEIVLKPSLDKLEPTGDLPVVPEGTRHQHVVPEGTRDLHVVAEDPLKQNKGKVREKPKILPKPKLKAPRVIDPATQDTSPADVCTPNNKPKILPKPSLNVPKETDSQREKSPRHGGSPKEKPSVLPKPRRNVPLITDQPNSALPVCNKTEKVKPNISPKPRLTVPKKEDRLQDDSTDAVGTPQKYPEIPAEPNTYSRNETEQSKASSHGEVPKENWSGDNLTLKETVNVPSNQSKEDTHKIQPKQVLTERDQPKNNDSDVGKPKGTDVEPRDILSEDAGAPEENTTFSSEPGFNVPKESDESTSKKTPKTSLKSTLNASQVVDPARFLFSANTGIYKGKRISSGSSLYDEQIIRSQIRRQSKQVENRRRAKRQEEERLAHMKREEEYREMIEEENITKKMQEWISRRSKVMKLEDESFHKEKGRGELFMMSNLESKLLNLKELKGKEESRDMNMVEEVLKQKLIQKESMRKENLEEERIDIIKQEEKAAGVLQHENCRQMRKLDSDGQRAERLHFETERRNLKTDVGSTDRKKREEKIRMMKESEEKGRKLTEKNKRDEDIHKEENLKEVSIQVKEEEGEKQNLKDLEETRERGSLKDKELDGDSRREGPLKLEKMDDAGREMNKLQEHTHQDDTRDESQMTMELKGEFLNPQIAEETGTKEDEERFGEDSIMEDENPKEDNPKEGEMTVHTAEMRMAHNVVTDTRTSRTSCFLLIGAILSVAVAIVLAGASVAVFYEHL
ncbi:trichohyalin-like isoform X2 [Mercenaria mercenaria]|uniref:trichohyalin-like isoform X2 n=1 Tax=Mercenaria mercenaria TaxID=6596 RepID=UPI00234F138F|nr:trichohyalin-like isoform X2 [Mercenaria mercenaria]